MEFLEWVNVLTDDQRKEFAGLEDNEVMGYLSDRGVVLPDEFLDRIAGGVGISELIEEILRRYQNEK